MKKHRVIIGFWLLVLIFFTTCQRRTTVVRAPISQPIEEVYNENNASYDAPTPSVTYQVFYDELAPYGSWVDYPQYGYVWVPRVGVDFHPYATNGHWVMTNYGWTWVSDYRWGWAAFHYGRWFYDSMYGWVWMPGNVWGPAWVSWRMSNDYFGWAPLAPFFDISISVHFNCPFDHYRFIPRRHFNHRNPQQFYLDHHHNGTFFNNTTYIDETHVVNNNRFYYGPRRDLVETASGQKIREARIDNQARPDADIDNNDRVKVYRPRIDNTVSDATRRPVPKQVSKPDELPVIPTEKRLTPSPRKEIPPKTEGEDRQPEVVQPNRPTRDEKPQEKPVEPKYEPRPEVKEPKREEKPQEKPIEPKYQPRLETKEPKRQEIPQAKPEVIRPQRQPVPQPKTEIKKLPAPAKPKIEPQPKVNQPRKTDVPKEKPVKTQPNVKPPTKQAPTPRPSRDKQAAPIKN